MRTKWLNTLSSSPALAGIAVDRITFEASQLSAIPNARTLRYGLDQASARNHGISFTDESAPEHVQVLRAGVLGDDDTNVAEDSCFTCGRDMFSNSMLAGSQLSDAKFL